MSEPNSSNELRFAPPGPGSWNLDAVHYPHPMTRYFQETQPPALKNGSQAFAHYYGMIINGLQLNFVNGFGYIQVPPAPESEIPERFKRAKEVFTQKLWREQVRDWDENCKPTSIAKHRELQSLNLEALSDDELVAYLIRCRDHHSDMITQHLYFTGTAIVPVGDFLAHAMDWTGLQASELLQLMQGSATISAGGSEELDRLKRVFTEDSLAREALLSEGDPAKTLTNLRSLKGAAGTAITDYLDLVGYRLVDGFDITSPMVLELPEAILKAIRITVSEESPATSDLKARTTEVRTKVPAKHQAMFDELLSDARLTYRIRDERGVYSDIWAAGLMRRAALSAGQRVTKRGQLTDHLQMLDASLDEMCELVLGTGGPPAEELAHRAAFRATYTSKNAPPSLGPPEPPPPDLSSLPPLAARVMVATFISLDNIFGSSMEQNEEKILHGLAACKGCYEGPARIVSNPSEFDRINKGDVLITESTSEAFNILLPLLGGIVTDNGGLLSHAAIVSREYGIPGVVGTREATERIKEGDRVYVDGDAGEVKVLK